MDKVEAVMKITPDDRMNIWVGAQVQTLEALIDHTRGMHTASHESYLRGVLAGIRMLQSEWLDGSFGNDK